MKNQLSIGQHLIERLAAQAHTSSYCLLEVHLNPLDRSPALQRLAERLAKRL